MAVLKRKVTVTMLIDTERHDGEFSVRVTEDGRLKKTWTPSQALTTAGALHEYVRYLMGFALDTMMAAEHPELKEKVARRWKSTYVHKAGK